MGCRRTPEFVHHWLCIRLEVLPCVGDKDIVNWTVLCSVPLIDVNNLVGPRRRGWILRARSETQIAWTCVSSKGIVEYIPPRILQNPPPRWEIRQWDIGRVDGPSR